MDERTAAILDTVRGLPEHTISVAMRSPRGTVQRSFRGVLLYDYARTAGLQPKPPSMGFGNYYFVATAEDGAMISLAYFEVTPRATAKQVLLAFEQDGEALRSGIRLVVPNDDLAGRSIGGVVSIDLRSVPSVEPHSHRPQAQHLTIGGLVEHAHMLTLEDLARYETHEVETQATPRRGGVMVAPRRYTGPLLWDILDDASPIVDDAINEDIMRRIVVARSTDGYGAVIAAGELDPRFMGGDVIIATHCNGAPLTDDEGKFRLIVPYDRAIGRALKSLTSIEVLQA